MRIGVLARQAGVSTSKIRFYEAEGLLPPAPRLANGYRDYTGRALEVIRFIERAQGLGFTLGDVAAHLGSPEGDGRKVRILAQLESKLADLDGHLRDPGSARLDPGPHRGGARRSREGRRPHQPAIPSIWAAGRHWWEASEGAPSAVWSKRSLDVQLT